MKTPSRLAIFALEHDSGLPIARMPVYAEIVVRSVPQEPPLNAPNRLNDQIQQGLSTDAPENLREPKTRQRLTAAISEEIDRQLGEAGIDELLTDGGALGFVAAVIKRVRAASDGVPLRNLDRDSLRSALRNAIAEEATKLGLATTPVAELTPTLWAYPLGVLATDHAGYLSYDLSRLPSAIQESVGKAVQSRRANPAAELDVTVAIYPTGPSGRHFDALAQGRITDDAVVARIELSLPAISEAVLNLALPAMQSPSLGDWRLSPGSFATNPGLLVGADGCETLLPANVALREYYFYQVVRLTDVEPPVAPVVKGQVQLGFVNEYRLAWNPLGHSLGQILYSMPLAPGESVNLAVIDWTRRDDAQRTERTTVDEQLVHDEHRDRTISEAVDTACANTSMEAVSWAASQELWAVPPEQHRVGSPAH